MSFLIAYSRFGAALALKVATDGLASYPRAIEEELGEEVEHEVRPCTANQSNKTIGVSSIAITLLWALGNLMRRSDSVEQWIK
ncbi:hypothetical protein [Synechococcus sp. PCC 7335]|uniref:hypothetical protein n=1 Tax=Synechococcus sp. (strain ATCC 29403 / PCC 7335) TaxID=91464 RepID=UPI001D0D3C49|nr:hypothetical protein [Synechococcus sp. PCC 7335]